ncbi:MAG: amidohydrolase family protein [Phycisphaerales bacterium]|nr:amidohydrolase family protein [Phycisphaerales bacterium]
MVQASISQRSRLTLLQAGAIYTGSGHWLSAGALVIARTSAGGLITDVGSGTSLRRRYPRATIQNYDNCVLMPGFVNAHTHLELGYLAGKLTRRRLAFPQWVTALMAAYPAAESAEAAITQAVIRGRRDSLAAGVTCVGDICRHHALVRAASRHGGPRTVSYGEITALGRSRELLTDRLAAAMGTAVARRRKLKTLLQIGLSPHAPYSVEGPALERIVAAANKAKMPLTMHLAELAAEADFLRDTSGPLGRRWQVMRNLNLLDDAVPRFAGGPIRWAAAHGLLRARVPVVLAHVNYASDAELDILAAGRASVAYCPRTRHYFGHDAAGPHRWRDMLVRGINVCLATDSLASNPDVSVLHEAAWLFKRDPSLDPVMLMELVTRRGAVALGLARVCGQLRKGLRGDIQAYGFEEVPGSPRAFAEALLAAPRPPVAVWLDGVNCTELRSQEA